VSKGEKLLLSGKNGSGKSTVANILSGFLSPQNGKAETFGLAQTSACIAPHTFVPGSVKDNVGYDGLDQEQKSYLHRLVDDFSLAASLEKDPGELSAGQKKKVEVMMGLMKKAGLYLFDEPLANVDAESKSEIMRHIFERSKNSALIVIMHGDEEFYAQFDHQVALS
jgi:ATP-binding cassette subfamily B protein